MREYLDEEFAYKELRRCAERALKRYLRPIEERKLRWLARMDCETIEVFVELFKEMQEDQSF